MVKPSLTMSGKTDVSRVNLVIWRQAWKFTLHNSHLRRKHCLKSHEISSNVFCLLVMQWIHPGKVGVYRFIWSSSFSAKWNYVVVMLSFAYWNNLPQFTFFGECPPYFYFARIVSPWTNTVSPGVSSNWTEQEKQRKIIWSNLTSFITYSIPRLVTEINVEPLCMCLTHKRQWASSNQFA